MSWRTYARALQEACLDVFADRDDAGEPKVFFEPEGGGTPVPLRSVYRDPHFEELLEQSRRPSSTRDVYADFLIADLPNYPPKRGDRVAVHRPLVGDPQDDVTVTRFSITDERPDGEGMTRLVLRLAT